MTVAPAIHRALSRHQNVEGEIESSMKYTSHGRDGLYHLAVIQSKIADCPIVSRVGVAHLQRRVDRVIVRIDKWRVLMTAQFQLVGAADLLRIQHKRFQAPPVQIRRGPRHIPAR